MTATEQAQARIFVVLNPMAGSANAADVRQALARQLGEQIQADFYETTGDQAEDIVAIVRAELANNPSVVVAAGGDGTISQVAEALIGTDTCLGIIPVGTANIFARELNIPFDLEAACALLNGQPHTTSVDAMKVGEQYFVLQIGIGIDSLMIRDTDRQSKRRFGRAAYILSLINKYDPTRRT
jgi:diacylglycerol kinase family enzyme